MGKMNGEIAICIFFVFALANAELSLNGTGGNYPWPVYADWIFAYSLGNPDAIITYTPLSSNESTTYLTNPSPTTDFFSTNALLQRTDEELAGRQDDLQLIPFVIGSIVPIYNIPTLKYADGSGFAKLVLSTDVLADIFRGRIGFWNDSRILVDNPDVLLPEEPITRVLRNDNSGFTYVFSSALALFVDDWEYTPSHYWPKEIQQLPNTIISADNFGLIADINKQPNSIGYISLAQLATQHISITTPYALLKNQQGNIVGPTEDYVVAAQNTIKTFDEHLFANFLNSQDPMAWPIILPSFLVIRTDVERDCEKDRELYEFIYWTKTSSIAISRLSELGYSRWADHLHEEIMNHILSAKCNGENNLRTEISNFKTTTAVYFFLGLGMALLGVSMILGGLWHYFNQSRCTKVVLIYQMILIVGVAISYISVIFWYMEPSSDKICNARVWLTTLGYSLILTAMFERTWQIRRVYGKVVKGNQLTTKVTGFFEVGGGIFIIMAIQFIILIIWTVKDPFVSVIQLGEDWEGTYTCQSNRPHIWLGLEGLYFPILLMWAIAIVYTTWSIRTFIVESRWILIAMYNVLLFLALLVTLFGTVDIDDFDLYFIIVPFIELATTTVVVAVYSPVVLRRLKLIASTDSLSGRSEDTSRKQQNTLEM